MTNTQTPAPTQVILLRHGRSTFNDQGRYQGASDESVLTAKGLADAHQTGIVLRETAFSAIYTSPLQRTQQTAQGIQSALHRSVPIKTHPDLKEVDLPGWAGLPYQYVRETMAADYRCWMELPHLFEMIGPQGVRRPVQDLYGQARQFWQQILPRHSGQTLLVVSHGGTIRALMGTALGLSCRHFQALQQSNCGISVLHFPGQGQPAHLEAMNDTSHLGEALPKLKAGKQGLRLLLVPSEEHRFQTVESLRTLLSPQDLSFSVSQGDPAERLSKAILSEHPQTVQLHTHCSDFHHLWLRTLNRRNLSGQSMMTGVLVAPSHLLQQMISQIMGAEQVLHLSQIAGRVSVVHCPTTQPAPILQAMNFAGPALIQQGTFACAS